MCRQELRHQSTHRWLRGMWTTFRNAAKGPVLETALRGRGLNREKMGWGMGRRASPWKQRDRVPFPRQAAEALRKGRGDCPPEKSSQASNKRNTSRDLNAVAAHGPESRAWAPRSLPIGRTLARSTAGRLWHAWSVNKQENTLTANNADARSKPVAAGGRENQTLAA